jgi:hypothetical protein
MDETKTVRILRKKQKEHRNTRQVCRRRKQVAHTLAMRYSRCNIS